jgi:hypothetical protein
MGRLDVPGCGDGLLKIGNALRAGADAAPEAVATGSRERTWTWRELDMASGEQRTRQAGTLRD